jgi:hypothetical protein
MDLREMSARATLVFPSEVAAAFWRRYLLRTGPSRAMREDAVISWDRFKEDVFGERHRTRPVNSTARALFVRELLERNSREPFLQNLIKPEYAAYSGQFAGAVSRILPFLRSLTDTGRVERLAPAIQADIRMLREEYGSFLRAAGLFEPTWQAPREPQLTGRYVICFPELLEDFGEFRSVLEGRSEIELYHLAEAAHEPLVEHDTAVGELDGLFAELERLLDSGVDPEELAVTVAGIEDIEPYLRARAARHEIPLSSRRGRPLTEYAAGALFRELQELVDGGMPLDTVKSLFLHQAIPWKQPAQARALIRLAVRHAVMRNEPGAGGGRDLLEGAIRRDDELDEEQRGELLRFYRSFRQSVFALVHAKDLSAVRRHAYAFFREFLNTDAWSRTEMRVFQRSLDVLSECIEMERFTDRGVAQPYSLWLSMLDEQLYVPRGEAPGVPLYPYRVSAGIVPRYHFVINCAHQTTAVVSKRWSFLREDHKEQLGLEDVDLTTSFLRGYALSGEQVRFSYAREGYDGVHIAPTWFVSTQRIEKATAQDPSGGRDHSRYAQEYAYWLGERNSLPARLYPDQLAGLRHFARVGLGHRSRDFGASRVWDPALRNLLRAAAERRGSGDRGTDAAGDEAGNEAGNEAGAKAAAGRGAMETPVAISATSLGDYRSCPFAFMLKHLLGLEEEDYVVVPDDARRLGSVYHRAFEVLFSEIQSSDGLLYRTHLRQYEEIVERIVSQVADGRFPGCRDIVGPLRPAMASVLERAMRELLEKELELHDGYRIEGIEQWKDAEPDGLGARLYGKIDRILRNVESGSLVLLDYKKGKLPAQREVGGRGKGESAEDGEGPDPAELTAIQLPFYARLLGAVGESVERAQYFSVRDRQLRTVFDAASESSTKPWVSPERWERVLEAVDRFAGEMVSGIAEGDYRFPDPEYGCDSCVFRGICRARFRVR